MRKLIFILLISTAILSNIYGGVTLYRDLTGHTNSVSCAAFSPDNNYLATSDLSGNIIIWDIATGASLLTINHGAPVETISFSPDSKYIASGARDNSVKLWVVVGGALIKTFEDFKTPLFSVAFSPDGRLLAGGSQNKIIVWGVKEQKKFQEIGLNNTWARSIHFSTDGRYLAAACGNFVEIWKIYKNDIISSLLQKGGFSFKSYRRLNHGMPLYTIAFSKDSQNIASAGEGSQIKFWRTEDGYLKWSNTAHDGIIWSLAISPDNKILASGGKDTLTKLWDTKNGRLINTIASQGDEVYSVAFSPDGSMLAHTTRDKQVKLWKLSLNMNSFMIKKAAATAATALILLIIAFIISGKFRKEKNRVKNWKP